MIRTPRRQTKGGRRAWLKVLVSCALAAVNLGWSDATVRWVAWSAVEFFPTDFQSHVRRHHARYDAGIRRELCRIFAFSEWVQWFTDFV